MSQNANSYFKKVGNYLFKKIIGKGSFALVFQGVNEQTNQEVAIKEINIEKFQGEEVQNEKILQFFKMEAQILKSLNHPNIIKLIDIINTSQNTYMIFEFCGKGDLDRYIKQNSPKGRLQESDAKPIIMQLFEAMRKLNSMNIVHRDLKLANVLINDQFQIKLADFGFAKLKEEQQFLESYCGTPITMAPEILSKNDHYDEKCDIWSLGVMIYQMIYGIAPFIPKNRTIESLLNTIQQSNLQFPSHIQVSDELIDLFKKMLVSDSTKRINFKDLFKHKWVVQNDSEQFEKESQNLLKSILTTSEEFSLPDESQSDSQKYLVETIQYEQNYDEVKKKQKQLMRQISELYSRLRTVLVKKHIDQFMQSYNELVDNDNDILVHLNKFVNNLKQRMDIVVIRLGYDEEKREIYCNKDLDNEKENEEQYFVKIELEQECYNLCLFFYEQYLREDIGIYQKVILKLIIALWSMIQRNDLKFSNIINVVFNKKIDYLNELSQEMKNNFALNLVDEQIKDINESKGEYYVEYDLEELDGEEREIFNKMIQYRMGN